MIQLLTKLFDILPTKKISLLFLLLLFLTSSVVEVFGIGIVGPFITLANKPEIIHQNLWLDLIFKYSGLDQETRFIALLGLLVIIIFSVRSIFAWLTRVYILEFSELQQVKIASKLVSNYLNAPYVFHIQNNSASIINNVLELIATMASGILIPLLTTISNILIAGFIIFLLCSVNPSIIIVFSIILLPLIFLYNSFKYKLEKWGKEGLIARQNMISAINHGLGGIKETRIIGCESYFERQLSEQSYKLYNLKINFFAFKFLPRYIVELLMISVIIGMISIFLFLNKNMDELTSLLGIYALAAIRMIPLISESMNQISTLRRNSYLIDKLFYDFKELEIHRIAKASKSESAYIPQNNSINFTEEIIIDSVSYLYPNASDKAIFDISLIIKKGELIALIGKSGAGKTTLVDLILGLLTPQAGDIQVDGQSIYQNIRAWQNSIGYIPQSIFLIDDTLERNIAFGVPDHLINQKRLDKAVESAQLTEVVNNLPNGVKTQVGERGVLLSGGQRQRVGIARALYHEREILVLDEATAALDNETEALVTNAIQSLSGIKTMIIIAHRLTTVQHCDRIYLLDQGRINKCGSYEDVVLK